MEKTIIILLLSSLPILVFFLGLLLVAKKKLNAAAATQNEELWHLRAEMKVLEARLQIFPSLEEENRTLNARLSSARERMTHLETALQKEREIHEEKLTLLQKAKEELSSAFHALSAQALERNNRSFLDLATITLEKFHETAKGDLSAREKAISELLKPIGSSLTNVDQKLADLEKSRISAYEVLRHQVGDLIHAQKELRSETANLVKALRTPHVRGRWGEMQLRRVVEMSGMSAHCDFTEQTTIVSDEGKQRPDMIVRLPGGKRLVVDAKAPLAAYLESLEEKEEANRLKHLRDHARQIRTHIQLLSSKSYWENIKEDSPEFVVLFLPGDTFFNAALEADPTLIELGVENRVILATPTTLIALLHAIAYGWRQENLTQNAKEIAQLGKDLYKRISDMGKHFAKVGQHLGQSVRCYNSTVASLESRVLPGARKLKELQGASPQDDIPEIGQLDHVTRNLQAPELIAENSDGESSQNLQHLIRSQ